MLLRFPPTKYFSDLADWEIELKHRWCRFLQTQLHTLYYLKRFLERQLNTEHYLGTLFNKESTLFRYYLIWGIWYQRRKLLQMKYFICAVLCLQILKIGYHPPDCNSGKTVFLSFLPFPHPQPDPACPGRLVLGSVWSISFIQPSPTLFVELVKNKSKLVSPHNYCRYFKILYSFIF